MGPPAPQYPARDERGVALVLVLLLTVAAAALSAGAILVSSNATIIARAHEREEVMQNAADAGIELARARLNGSPTLFPDTGYAGLESDEPVRDATGTAIPGVTRSSYAGPTGNSTGQYGVFGSVVSVVRDRSGALAVRRAELSQESFAKYAYYTNSEGTGICFGGGDQIMGPLHTNTGMCIYSSGARYRGPVTVGGTITGRAYGAFEQGYAERAATIPLPAVAALTRLNSYAIQGGTSFIAPLGGSTTQSRLRIEFVTVDLDGDGRVTGANEGFFKVYIANSSTNAQFVTGTRPTVAGFSSSRNCGDAHLGVFYTAGHHRVMAVPGHTGTPGVPAAIASLSAATRRCYLIGGDRLNLVAGRNTFVATDSLGAWQRYTLTPSGGLVAGLKNPASGLVDTTLATRTTYAGYLFPLSRQLNPDFKGVIYVSGKVVVSGVAHGRVTLVASDNIILADDLTYAIAPGSAACPASDMLGLLTPASIVIADNVINAPWDGSGAYRSYDDSDAEFFHAVLLALGVFTAENYVSGSIRTQPCEGRSAGRGCLYITGGIIQATRGAVGTTVGHGYIKRYAYDQCARQTPPPYFPTTGRFARNRYYELDPVGFEVGRLFTSLRPSTP